MFQGYNENEVLFTEIYLVLMFLIQQLLEN